MPSEIDLSNIAFYEKERKGIYIHASLLKGSPFAPGDRFSVRTGKTQLFAVTIKKVTPATYSTTGTAYSSSAPAWSTC